MVTGVVPGNTDYTGIAHLYIGDTTSRAREVKESACKSHHSVLRVQFIDTVSLPQPALFVPSQKYQADVAVQTLL